MSRHFKIITKEVGRDNPIETEYIGDVDRSYLIKFFGLREPDVEWFRICLLYTSPSPRDS